MSRGFSLIEALLAMSVVAIATLVLSMAISSGSRATASATDPVRGAVDTYAAYLFRDAAQAWKYGSPGAAPAGIYATSIPLAPSAAPLAVRVTSAVTAAGAQNARVEITVQSKTYTASAGGVVFVRAQLPNARVLRPGLVPQPSAAPLR